MAVRKITSICWGLISASLVLLVIYFAGLDRALDQIFLDDFLFGIRTKLFFLFYVVGIAANGLVIFLLKRKNNLGFIAGAIWSGFNLLENLSDIWAFRFYPHAITEELMLVFIYAYMVWLCLGAILQCGVLKVS